MPTNTGSDRGEQMKHRASNLHVRHMSDVRGAVGCYYCWIGQYDRCNKQCQLVRVTDRDHQLAQTGGAADHRDVLYAWDHSAPVLTHAATQANTFYSVPAPKEAEKWVKSAASAGGGGKGFLSKENYVTVSRHVPEQNPWITSSRRQQNLDLLKSISSNVRRAEQDRQDAHARRHETKLFSLLLPQQFVPPYKYPHGSVTVQATPYTQISMKQQQQKQRAQSAGASRASVSPQHKARRRETLDGWGVYDDFGGDAVDAAQAVRERAIEQRRQNEQALRDAGRPIFLQTKHGGRYVTADSAVMSGAKVKGATSSSTVLRGINNNDDDPYCDTLAEEEQQQLNQVLSSAEQLRAALDGRSIQKLRQDKLDMIRGRNAAAAVLDGSRGVRSAHSARMASASAPAVMLENTGGAVLSGRFSSAMAMPVPDSFNF